MSYIDRRHEVVDILQAARLNPDELAQATALHRHFAGSTGVTYPGVHSFNFIVGMKHGVGNTAQHEKEAYRKAKGKVGAR